MSHKKLVDRFLKLHKKTQTFKSVYAEIDEITAQLAAKNFRSYPIKKAIVILADNFASKNVAYRTTSIKRYELKIEDSRQ